MEEVKEKNEKLYTDQGLPAHNSPNLIFRKERTELTIHKSRIVAELAEKKEILFSQEEDMFCFFFVTY